MRKQTSWVLIGTACIAFTATGATAQVGLGVEGAVRGAGSVTPGGVGGAADAEADAAAAADARVDLPSDAQIVVGVQTALSNELHIQGVRSEVDNGVATLHGTVATEAEKERAERIARRVDGVTRVRNELVVSGAANTASNAGASVDSVVAGHIKSDPQLAARNIVVDTRNKVVTLTGQVESVAEKEAAGRIATDAAAGAEVRNELTVRAENCSAAVGSSCAR